MFLATKYPKKSENPKKAKKKNFFYSSPFVNHRRLERCHGPKAQPPTWSYRGKLQIFL
jgi:hypothetical protein